MWSRLDSLAWLGPLSSALWREGQCGPFLAEPAECSLGQAGGCFPLHSEEGTKQHLGCHLLGVEPSQYEYMLSLPSLSEEFRFSASCLLSLRTCASPSVPSMWGARPLACFHLSLPAGKISNFPQEAHFPWPARCPFRVHSSSQLPDEQIFVTPQSVVVTWGPIPRN